MEKWYTLGKFVSGLIPRLTSARDTGAVTCQREGDIGDWTSRLISFEIKRLIFRWCSARFQPLSRFFVRKFLVSPTVLKNLRYFIRPLYFSRTGFSQWWGARSEKSSPTNNSVSYSTDRISILLSLLKIKLLPFILSNLMKNSYRSRNKFTRKFVSGKLKFISFTFTNIIFVFPREMNQFCYKYF